MTLRRFTHSLALCALLASAWLFAPGCATAPNPRLAQPITAADTALRNEVVFDEATRLVSKKFFDAKFNGKDWPALVAKHRQAALTAPNTDAFYRELNTLFDELDVSHLYAATPRDVREQAEQKRARIGLDWHKYGSDWVVERVVPESPAAAAGVQIGWVAVSVNGASLESRLPLRLDEGQEVTVVFRDEANQLQSRTMAATLLSMAVEPTERILDGGIVLLKFNEFDRASRRWLSNALKRHAQAPGVIVDLRRNYGGQLFSLDIVVGELFPKSVPIGRWISRDGDDEDGSGRQWSAARYAGPLAVLIDDSTYSAAEILAHVVQYHKRAKLFGRKTGGAVIAARSYDLPDGGRMDIPVIDFVGLDGQRLEKRGVTPDVQIERSLQALREGRDLDIEAALSSLRK